MAIKWLAELPNLVKRAKSHQVDHWGLASTAITAYPCSGFLWSLADLSRRSDEFTSWARRGNHGDYRTIAGIGLAACLCLWIEQARARSGETGPTGSLDEGNFAKCLFLEDLDPTLAASTDA